MTLRALIVDDEPPARKRLRHLLKDESRLVIVGEAGNGVDALSQIENKRPDLVFLDIQMPKMTGFEVLDALPSKRPLIVFTTAFDRYAIRAFDVNALDYLLKPFDRERLSQAVTRAIDNRRSQTVVDEKIDRLLAEIRRSHLRRLWIRTGNRQILLDLADVLRIEAREKYVQLFTHGESYLHRESIRGMEEKLDPAEFIRTHRSHIVRIDCIREIAPWARGEGIVIMKNGERIPVGRQFKTALLEKIGASSTRKNNA